METRQLFISYVNRMFGEVGFMYMYASYASSKITYGAYIIFIFFDFLHSVRCNGDIFKFFFGKCVNALNYFLLLLIYRYRINESVTIGVPDWHI